MRTSAFSNKSQLATFNEFLEQVPGLMLTHSTEIDDVASSDFPVGFNVLQDHLLHL